jgi:HPt (histidine-containing phosphotransfer) domain-containing protein
MAKFPEPLPPIIKEEALARIGGEEEFLKELLEIYRDEFDKRYTALRKAIEEKDFQAIRENGHSLKGASDNLSLPGLREAAFEMEMAGKNQEIDKAVKALNSLKKEFDRLEIFLGQNP